ncbi:MAG TPA: hypothetical protein VLK78_08495 [Candidatus Angelobacter sp.]|nr:hypothetical protein [Candidatus Angelobacter sp.]
MLADKMINKSESVVRTTKNRVMDKLENVEKMTAEEVVQFLSDSLFKLVLFLGVPYFIFVLIQFLLK